MSIIYHKDFTCASGLSVCRAVGLNTNQSAINFMTGSLKTGGNTVYANGRVFAKNPL